MKPFFSNFAETSIPLKKFSKIWFVAKRGNRNAKPPPENHIWLQVGRAEPETPRESLFPLPSWLGQGHEFKSG